FRKRIASPRSRGEYALLPMEPRMMINSPISPGLQVDLFGTNADYGLYNDDLTSYYKLDFSSAAIDHTTATDLNFAAPTITDPTTGQTYDTYRIRYTGSIDVAADGVYFFRAPSADGVILDIDQKHVLFAASIVGDADLN